MLNITRDTKVDTDRYLALMRLSNLVYFNTKEFQQEFYRESAKLDGLEKNILEYMNFYSDYAYDKLTTDTAKDYLKCFENVPPDEFVIFDKKTRNYRESFDKTVREKIRERGYSPYFFSIYDSYADNESALNSTRTFVNCLRDTKFVDNYNNPVASAPFFYNKAKTGRIYTKQLNIQGLPLDYCKYISSVKDYFLLWFDFKQIDFRVAWNLILRYINEKEISKHEDTPDYYKMFAKDLYLKTGKEFNEEEFQADRGKYKTGTLATMYGSSISTIRKQVNDDKFVQTLHDYINSPNNFGYNRYKNYLVKNINDDFLFDAYTYFGTVMKLHPDTDGVLTAGLNRPIQGTAADIIKIITLEIYDRVQKHINNPMRFYPYLNRHDECLFMCHKSVLPYLYEFLDCVRIQVDDWDPLELEWSAGYNYKIEDEELINKIKTTVQEHPLTPKVVTKPSQEFFPFTIAKDLQHYFIKEGNYFYSLIYSYNDAKAICYVEKKEPVFEKMVEDYIKTNCKEERGLSRIIIASSLDFYKYFGDIEVFTRSDEKDNRNSVAKCILSSIAKEHIKRHLEKTPPDYLVNNANDIVRKGTDITWRISY